MPLDTDTEQTAAESPAAAPVASPTSAPAAASEPRPQLASFEDALRKAESSAKPAEPKGTTQGARTDASVLPGASATAASKPDGTQPPSAVDPASAAPPADGESADTASKPDTESKDDAGKASQDEKPSRRGAAQIKALEAERDQIAAERDQLRAASTIPDHILQAATSVRLSDDEFNALAAKKSREDLTGDYLTTDEVEKYSRALQVRDWSAPWYQDAQRQAATWAEGQRQAVMNAAAEQLAPILRETDYLSPETVGRSQSWSDVYRHIRDASHDAGRQAERAALQPKLDDANGRISDLEAELSGLRTADVGRGRPLERGGTSGGAYAGRPNLRTAGSASDLFSAAIAESERRSQRRASSARAS